MNAPKIIHSERMKDWVIFYTVLAVIVFLGSNIFKSFKLNMGGEILWFIYTSVLVLHLAYTFSRTMQSQIYANYVFAVIIFLVLGSGVQQFYKTFRTIDIITNYMLLILICWGALIFIKNKATQYIEKKKVKKMIEAKDIENEAIDQNNINDDIVDDSK